MKSKKIVFLIFFIAIFAGIIAYPKIPTLFGRDLSYKLGLDLQGGVELLLEADMSKIAQADRQDAIAAAKEVIDRRVNFLGVGEPVIQTSKKDTSFRIIVELPGLKDERSALKVVGTTAQLNFLEMDTATTSAQFIPTDVTGKDLKKAYLSFDTNTGKPEISFELNTEGSKKFKELTTRILKKEESKRQLAIALDNQILSAPVVQSVIEDRGRITGNFTRDEAKQLAIQLNAGALPVPLLILSERKVGATLGEESIHKSLVAGAIGGAAVILFMIFYYRFLGIFASFALVIYTLIVLSIFKLIPVTLTLAGIAGFILSIGMAVDANILIFERFKEELRWGKPKNIALDAGFNRAWTSIRDSNISSLITAGILYYFGSGQVRGFALVLAIGVLVSMFSAIIVTRTFLRLVFRN